MTDRLYIVANRSTRQAALQLFHAADLFDDAEKMAETYLGPKWRRGYFVGVLCPKCGHVTKDVRAKRCSHRRCGVSL